MLYSLAADLIVVIHLAYVGYIVGGVGLILIGLWRRWRWIRNPWCRLTHLIAILIVVIELVLKTYCPLTIWEMSLRSLAHQPVNGAAFMDRLMAVVLFAAVPPWITTRLYFVFALIIASAFLFAPPRLSLQSNRRSQCLRDRDSSPPSARENNQRHARAQPPAREAARTWSGSSNR